MTNENRAIVEMESRDDVGKVNSCYSRARPYTTVSWIVFIGYFSV